MRRRIAVLLGMLVAAGLTSCRAPATADTSLAPLEAVVASPATTPTKPSRPIALNTAAASPVAEQTPPPAGAPIAGSRPAATNTPVAAVAAATVATTGTSVAPRAAVTATPTASTVATASGSPARSGTPVARETPAVTIKAEGSDELKALTAQLEDRVDNLRQALREKDVDTAIRLQRELLGILSQADGTLGGEKSDLADKLRRVAQLLKQGLGGDLARIDDAAGTLRQLVGRPASTRAIADLYRYASDLAGKVAAFKKARASGDVSSVFRVQSDLLGEISRAQSDLTPGRTKATDAVLAALADIQAGLDGKLDRLDAGEATLNEIARIPTQRSATPTVTPTAAPPTPVGAPPSAPATGSGATVPNVSTTPVPGQ